MVSYKFTLKATPNVQGEYFINLVLIKDRINTSLSIKKKKNASMKIGHLKQNALKNHTKNISKLMI
jgi:hypothetical protein